MFTEHNHPLFRGHGMEKPVIAGDIIGRVFPEIAQVAGRFQFQQQFRAQAAVILDGTPGVIEPGYLAYSVQKGKTQAIGNTRLALPRSIGVAEFLEFRVITVLGVPPVRATDAYPGNSFGGEKDSRMPFSDYVKRVWRTFGGQAARGGQHEQQRQKKDFQHGRGLPSLFMP